MWQPNPNVLPLPLLVQENTFHGFLAAARQLVEASVLPARSNAASTLAKQQLCFLASMSLALHLQAFHGFLAKLFHAGSENIILLLALLMQENTFLDFLAVARHLVEAGYTSREGLAVWGRSAGGLTLGASLNMDPGVSGSVTLKTIGLKFNHFEVQKTMTLKLKTAFRDHIKCGNFDDCDVNRLKMHTSYQLYFFRRQKAVQGRTQQGMPSCRGPHSCCLGMSPTL
jgi:hypothetical protein